MDSGPSRERSSPASWLEILDWWRVYVPLLGGMLLAAAATWAAPSFAVAAVLAVGAIAASLIVGSVCQGSRRP